MVDLLSIQSIADANLQLVQPVEHVELGERYARDAVRATDWRTSAASNSRNGACAPSPSRIHGALSQEAADLIVSSVGNGPSPTRVV